MLRRHLELAREHVALGQKLVERQRQLVADLQHDGHPSEIARKMLAVFENVQKMHVENRDMILSEIADTERRRW